MISASINERIRQALIAKDWEGIDALISDSSRFKEKRARLAMQRTVNSIIIEYAFQNDSPELLLSIRIVPPESAEGLFSTVLNRYFATGDRRWFDILFPFSEKLGKKSLQSKIVAFVVHELIAKGIAESRPAYIEQGLEVLNKITFRKYRSDCIIDSAFRIAKWTVLTGDISLLLKIRSLIAGINDISKRAALHAEVAQATGAIAVKKSDFDMFLESLHFTVEIHQKVRRRECINHIIISGMKSSFGRELLEIRSLVVHFEKFPEEIQKELIYILTEQILDRTRNKNQVQDDFAFLAKKMPFSVNILVQNLLNKAERSGDPWYLNSALVFLNDGTYREKCPVKDIVRSGIAVARHVRSAEVLMNLIPLIQKSCGIDETTGIFLQFSQIMLALGDFESATSLFSQINAPENSPQYVACLAKLIEEGISRDQSSQKFLEIIGKNEEVTAKNAISIAVRQIGHVTPFEEVVRHNDSLKQVLILHPGYDGIILDLITTLTARGFLDFCDSVILVDLAKLIQASNLREQAISSIVTKLAEIGVKTVNRDYLQQAVGITCLIEGQDIRSSTLSSIIDDAALLAATQGDLDLLLRMRVWSSSFLDPDLVSYAIKNIIEGVIKYATSKKDPDALDEAYRIAVDVEDPSLRLQICERITESYVRIGCDLIFDNSAKQVNSADSPEILKTFQKGLSLLNIEVKKPQVSLKIAGMIDIILSSSKKSTCRDYILPLAMYAIEIENPLERDAMMLRIVAKLNEDILYPDSADPYEVIAYILQHRYRVQTNPEIVWLIHRLNELTRDPFVRLRGLCTLANTAKEIDSGKLSLEILDRIYSSVSKLPAEYQKVLVLGDLAASYRTVDPEKSRACLEEGLNRLSQIEPDHNTGVRRQLVSVIVNMHSILTEEKRTELILEVVATISDPIEYVRALISAYTLEHENTGKNTILNISEAIKKIDSPYDQSMLILRLVPLAIRNGEEDFALDLLSRAEKLSSSINIQHIADSIRDEIARIFVDYSRKQGDAQFMKKSANVLADIEDDDLRKYRLAQLGYDDSPEKSVPHTKIMATLSRIVNESAPPSQVVALEQAVRTVPDRGKRALIYCRLSILSRDKADLKTAKRMLNNAIKESDIIRPLSRRAFIRCDMAIKMYSAGYESLAQDILDNAIDAATNIRQSGLRDDVFNELGLVIRIMQGGGSSENP